MRCALCGWSISISELIERGTLSSGNKRKRKLHPSCKVSLHRFRHRTARRACRWYTVKDFEARYLTFWSKLSVSDEARGVRSLSAGVQASIDSTAANPALRITNDARQLMQTMQSKQRQTTLEAAGRPVRNISKIGEEEDRNRHKDIDVSQAT